MPRIRQYCTWDAAAAAAGRVQRTRAGAGEQQPTDPTTVEVRRADGQNVRADFGAVTEIRALRGGRGERKRDPAARSHDDPHPPAATQGVPGLILGEVVFYLVERMLGCAFSGD